MDKKVTPPSTLRGVRLGERIPRRRGNSNEVVDQMKFGRAQAATSHQWPSCFKTTAEKNSGNLSASKV